MAVLNQARVKYFPAIRNLNTSTTAFVGVKNWTQLAVMI
jgi:hypothetical protein